MSKFLKLTAVGCTIILGCVAQGLANPPSVQPRLGGACAVGPNVPVPMRVIATRTGHDPSSVWSDWDLWHPFAPRRTTIWEGRVTTCLGAVVVSQIENRECSGPATCPVRVALVEGQKILRLMDYEQVCMLHDTFMLSGDGRALIACNREFPLGVR